MAVKPPASSSTDSIKLNVPNTLFVLLIVVPPCRRRPGFRRVPFRPVRPDALLPSTEIYLKTGLLSSIDSNRRETIVNHRYIFESFGLDGPEDLLYNGKAMVAGPAAAASDNPQHPLF
jgi:hypothetical protein